VRYKFTHPASFSCENLHYTGAPCHLEELFGACLVDQLIRTPLGDAQSSGSEDDELFSFGHPPSASTNQSKCVLIVSVGGFFGTCHVGGYFHKFAIWGVCIVPRLQWWALSDVL
jgi:hypothetical protein